MTCEEFAELLDAFVDAELPAPKLLGVARHAGGCPGCDRAARELTAMREAVERGTKTEAEALDLSAVWPAVERRVAGVDTRRAWRRRLWAAPAWGVGLAAAAGALFWLHAPGPEPVRVTARPRPNQAVIERLDSGGGRFEVRSERKYGTVLIMVNGAGDEAGR